jgi:nicotinate phosphoribosyltransferase
MSLATLGVDAYQITTLIAQANAGRLPQRLAMAFFFRKLPRQRNYVLFCGLRSMLEHAAQLALDDDELATLRAHPIIGPALGARPEVAAALRALDGFEGEIDALPEGTLAFAGPGVRTDGRPLLAGDVPIQLYTPLLQVRTDMLRAKLIETPWLGRINHLSMVASKAARVADAAAGKPVLEFGARRTHPAAAVDAAYAAHLAGCSGTSNLAAQHRWGIPAFGTMDHFFIQAAERPGVSVSESERAAFALFARTFPGNAALLVDTYDTERGIRNAVAATDGKLSGIRLDCNVTVENVRRARAILDEMGAPQARILVSDALDEYRVRELAPVADAFGVGENITCSPDAAAGVGAVAKVIVNGYGKVTMKVSRGSGKATLPGALQVYRFDDHDLIALAGEPPPLGGRALLQPVWRGRAPVGESPTLDQSRAWARQQIEALPPHLRALEPATPPWKLVASDGLAAQIDELVAEARA